MEGHHCTGITVLVTQHSSFRLKEESVYNNVPDCHFHFSLALSNQTVMQYS